MVGRLLDPMITIFVLYEHSDLNLYRIMLVYKLSPLNWRNKTNSSKRKI